MASAAASAGSVPHDCIKGIQGYINRILKPKDRSKEIPGMKCLLLDKETKGIVAMVYSMNEILTKDVFLVESLDGAHESVGHLKAVCLLRPSPDNVRSLVAHLREPKFAEYHLFFTNIVPQDVLRKVADADHLGVVKSVQEAYADYYAISSDTFTLNLGGSLALSKPKSAYSTAEEMLLKRCTSSILAMLLSFKVKPYVRYLASSDAAAAVAREVTGTIGGERELFTFQRTGGVPLLLVLDRREDTVTPLLTQWTYQAMVHELLPGGIKNNRVDMKHVKGVAKDLEEVVLSPTDDTFFRDHMYSNYGDLAAGIKSMLDDYTASQKTHETITSIEDMQRFVDKYPELKSKGLAVGKHVALMGDLAAAVDGKRLMEMSELEQAVACTDAPLDQLRDITALFTGDGPQVDAVDALRLLMLYTLRYEKSRPAQVAELRRLVSDRFDMRGSLDLVDSLVSYGGAGQRSCDLFGANASVFSRLAGQVSRQVGGVTNVYTQHHPLLTSLLDQLAKGKLPRTTFPFVGAEPPPGKISTVIVFVVGGITFEEAAKVAAINNGMLQIGGAGAPAGTTPPPFRVVLGGTTVHNSKTFLAELQRLSSGSVSVDMGAGVGGDLR